MTTTFTKAVETFITNADWLGPLDMPELVSIQHMAAELDKGIEGRTAILNAFNLSFRSLRKRKPADSAAEDPFEAALREGQGG